MWKLAIRCLLFVYVVGYAVENGVAEGVENEAELSE
jgi:hypothetical protein